MRNEFYEPQKNHVTANANFTLIFPLGSGSPSVENITGSTPQPGHNADKQCDNLSSNKNISP